MLKKAVVFYLPSFFPSSWLFFSDNMSQNIK